MHKKKRWIRKSVRMSTVTLGRHGALLTCIALFILLFQLEYSALSAQTRAENVSADYSELSRFVLDRYGVDQVLANGVIYTDTYWRKEGHQFLGEDRIYTGDIVLRGKKYEGLGMKYDICNRQLIIFLNTDPPREGIIPPHDFISAFSLDGKHFRKLEFAGEPQFFQVVFESENLKCLYIWSKKVMETAGRGNYKFYHYEFSGSRRQGYLLINGSFEPYRNNRTFTVLFPQHLRTGISRYMKTNRMKVSGSSDEQMSELMKYCNSIIQ